MIYLIYSTSNDEHVFYEFIEREEEYVFNRYIKDFMPVVNIGTMVNSYAKYRQDELIWIQDCKSIRTMEEANKLYKDLTDNLVSKFKLPEFKYKVYMFACEDVMQCVEEDSEDYYKILYEFKDKYLNMYASISLFSRVLSLVYNVLNENILFMTFLLSNLYVWTFIAGVLLTGDE